MRVFGRTCTAIFCSLALVVGTAAAATAKPAPKVIGFSNATYEVTEGTADATMTLTRSPAKGKTAVSFATGGGSASDGGDYTAVSTKITFTSGQSQATVQVPIVVDRVAGEHDETVGLTLSNPGGGWALGTSSATLTIHEMAVPSAPTGLVASMESNVNGDFVHLTWTASSTGPVDWYEIWSSTTSGSGYTKVPVETNGTQFTDLAALVTTYYVVRARNADGATSGYSNEAVLVV